MSDTVAIEPGTVVTASPFLRGKQLPAQRGIVLHVARKEGVYSLVWFPKMGDPAPGASVQGVFPGEMSEARPLAGEAPSFVRRAYEACRRVNRAGGWQAQWREAGHAIERVAREVVPPRQRPSTGRYRHLPRTL